MTMLRKILEAKPYLALNLFQEELGKDQTHSFNKVYPQKDIMTVLRD